MAWLKSNGGLYKIETIKKISWKWCGSPRERDRVVYADVGDEIIYLYSSDDVACSYLKVEKTDFIQVALCEEANKMIDWIASAIADERIIIDVDAYNDWLEKKIQRIARGGDEEVRNILAIKYHG